jgi:hypothetical protein
VLPAIELRPLASLLETATARLQDARTNSLWKLTVAPRSNGDARLNATGTNAPATLAEFRVDSDMSDLEREVYRKLDQRGYLTPPESGSDIPVLRWLGSAFEPAVFHIGKTSVSCSLVSAIKNRNPLCLLNQTNLSVSW